MGHEGIRYVEYYEKCKGFKKTGLVLQSQIGFWSTKEFSTLKRGFEKSGRFDD